MIDTNLGVRSSNLFGRATVRHGTTEHPVGAEFREALLRATIVAPFRGLRFAGAVTSLRDTVIDNPDQVECLVAKLRESLPLLATVTPEVAAVIREQSPAADPLRRYSITRVDYAGDEGGIVCKVELGPENDDRALFASITHLRFGHAGPIARQIAAYQKHRVKRLRRLGEGSPV